MKTIRTIVGMFSLGLAAAQADTIKLADGTTLEGELGAPAEVTVKTAAGEKRVSFQLLPLEVQKVYWRKAAEEAATAAGETASAGPVTNEELAALANDVNLDTWEQVASIGSFRDKPEKRGQGGLVVAKAFNAIEENWVTVYSPKDPVGQAGDWETQVSKAKLLLGRTPQFLQKRWLETFIRAGEAVAQRDSDAFAQMIRELKRNPVRTAAVENFHNFFTAK